MEDQWEKDAAGTHVDALREFVVRHGNAQHDTTQLAAASEVLTAFDEAALEVLLLKGAGLGALLYGSAQRRGYSDIDLLVALGRLDAAEDVLRGLGYKNATAIQGVQDVGGNVHAQTWIRADPAQVDKPVIDLHWTLDGTRAAPANVWRALWSGRTEIELAGRHATVPDRPGQAMHLAMHAAQHGPKFDKHVNELSLALARWPRDVWESAAALAQQIEALEPFAAGLRLAPRGALLASNLGLPSTAELDWTIQHNAGRPRGTFHVRALVEAESVAERVRVLRRSLFPGRAWITYEHPWARGGRLRLAAAYGVHLMRAPLWAARAFAFMQRARRAS